MAPIPHATLQAVTDAAAEATAASHAWLLSLEGDELVAVVAIGPGGAAARGQVVGAGEGSAGYVLASGQPLALQLSPGDTNPWSSEHPLVHRVPSTILSVPCEAAAGLVGVLELVDKADGWFSFDDVEVATLLGGIAGAALADAALRGPAVAEPDELGRELAHVFDDDPPRYARVATVLQALLSYG